MSWPYDALKVVSHQGRALIEQTFEWKTSSALAILQERRIFILVYKTSTLTRNSSVMTTLINCLWS